MQTHHRRNVCVPYLPDRKKYPDFLQHNLKENPPNYKTHTQTKYLKGKYVLRNAKYSNLCSHTGV